MIPLAPGFWEGANVARWNRALWVAPDGLGWFVDHIPITGSLATLAQVVVAASALAGAIGLYPRASLSVLTISTFYLFSIAQLGGHVWHDMHLLWFAALLAVSPCADVMAVDSKRPLFSEGVEYAKPLFVARLLLSAIYFFPGLHKLARSGVAWALSDNLRNQMYWKWAEYGRVPSLRFDRPEWLLPLGGLFVLAFELSFPALALFRRTRPALAVLGIAFHLVAQVALFIPFASLWACYVALVDLRPFVRFFRPDLGSPSATEPASTATSNLGDRLRPVVFGSLIAGAMIQGARGQTRSYPFACYPTFEWRAGTEMPDLLVMLVGSDGTEAELATGERGRTQREWAAVWSLAGVTTSTSLDRLRAYYASLLSRDRAARERSNDATSVRFYRVHRSVLPDRQGAIVRRDFIAEMALPAR
jgi:hypothetical protein